MLFIRLLKALLSKMGHCWLLLMCVRILSLGLGHALGELNLCAERFLWRGLSSAQCTQAEMWDLFFFGFSCRRLWQSHSWQILTTSPTTKRLSRYVVISFCSFYGSLLSLFLSSQQRFTFRCFLFDRELVVKTRDTVELRLSHRFLLRPYYRTQLCGWSNLNVFKRI